MADIRRFLMLGAATLAMGTLIAAGCSDDEDATTSTTQSTSSSMGGNGAGGNGAGATGGGTGECTPGDVCEMCAAEACPTEALACCQAEGCQELVLCVGQNCQDATDQTACAIANCPDEVGAATAAGSVAPAQDLGACLTPALENPTMDSCTQCAEMFGTGGAGGAGGGAGGN